MPTERVDRLDLSTQAAGDPVLLTAREAARLCGFSLRTWWRLDSAGKIPAAIRFGRSKRWSAETLRAWVKAGCPDRKCWESMRIPSE